MKRLAKGAKLALLCGVIGTGAGIQAEQQATSLAAQTERTFEHARASYTGKVVVVNKEEKTFTVEIEGQLYLFKLNPRTVLLAGGKSVKGLELLPGQLITLTLEQLTSGTILVASINVELGEQETEAAGSTPDKLLLKRKPHPPRGPKNRPPVVSPHN